MIRPTIAALVALLTLAGCGTSELTPETPTTVAASPSITLTGKAAVEAAVAAISAANRGDREDSTEVLWASDGPIITIPAADSLTRGLIKAGFWRDAETILRAVQTAGLKPAPDRVTIIGTMPMQTADGEPLGEMAVLRGRWDDPMAVDLDRTTAEMAADEISGQFATG